MYNTPIAYFLTFTVRGSWRHGDSRGSWKRNGQFVAPDSDVKAEPNKNPPHYFSEEECYIIENAMEEVCTERQWILHEKSVLYNHVHAVVTAPDTLPENVMRLLKAKATMRLRKAGFVGAEEKIWTQHGSTKYLFDEESFQTVCEYVREQKPDKQKPE
jgi:REP element-mobilizing transposase RayT